MDLSTPVQFLKGVGPKIALLLKGKDIEKVEDLVFYFPRDYQDRSKILTPSELAKIPAQDLEGTRVLVRGQIAGHNFIPIRKLKRPLLEARLVDAGSPPVGKVGLSLKWFQYQRGFFETKFQDNPTVLAYGVIRNYNGRREIIHPELEWESEGDDAADKAKIYPVYSESEGLNQRLLHKIIEQALGIGLREIVDDLPTGVVREHALVSARQAVEKLHKPDIGADIEALRESRTPEQRRMIFEEFFKFEWIIGKKRLALRRESTDGFDTSKAQALLAKLKKNIPFELTDDQISAIAKIFEDLASTKPMNRLLQGDVGCGKTLVALAAALSPIANGAQTAFMAPTEILAEQHLKNAEKYLGGIVRAEILVGSTTKAKKTEILARLARGEIDVLIGTHALIEDPVIFPKLGLVIVDEQHRFGVDQRLKLRAKGKNPHVLSLTATPIPRTLALTAYGDLDVTSIRQLPKGRPEITTKVVTRENKTKALQALRAQLEEGRQAYVIFPLVEESEKIDLQNAVDGAEELAHGTLKGWKVGLLHGRMKGQEKTEIMERFKRREIDVLVSTTVIEVGVDVPNATVMLIENADRFGLSQLHQLRGRVGRGTEESFCFLVSENHSQTAQARLEAMEETRDGFKLSELDLEIRGPGEFLGTRQSGELQFKYANLVRDQELLIAARKSAFELLQKDPMLEDTENRPLRNYMERRGELQQKRFGTA